MHILVSGCNGWQLAPHAILARTVYDCVVRVEAGLQSLQPCEFIVGHTGMACRSCTLPAGASGTAAG